MKEITEFLLNSDMQYFATLGIDGKPKVRPFQFMFEEGGKLWYCTSNKKKVYQEIKGNPFVEICVSGKDMTWLRLSAKAVFSDDLAIKAKIFKKSPLVAGIYKRASNPDFVVFYLDDVLATISKIGEQPIVIRL